MLSLVRREVRQGGEGGSWNVTLSNNSWSGRSKSNSWLGGEPCNFQVRETPQYCSSSVLLGRHKISIMDLPTTVILYLDSSSLVYFIAEKLCHINQDSTIDEGVTFSRETRVKSWISTELATEASEGEEEAAMEVEEGEGFSEAAGVEMVQRMELVAGPTWTRTMFWSSTCPAALTLDRESSSSYLLWAGGTSQEDCASAETPAASASPSRRTWPKWSATASTVGWWTSTFPAPETFLSSFSSSSSLAASSLLPSSVWSACASVSMCWVLEMVTCELFRHSVPEEEDVYSPEKTARSHHVGSDQEMRPWLTFFLRNNNGIMMTEYNPNYEFAGGSCSIQDLREVDRENLILVKWVASTTSPANNYLVLCQSAGPGSVRRGVSGNSQE